ncbi:MAG: pyridoxal phosphate-dependent aminotransferase [Chloroflexi bacterium]|nr:pyridoxal phosphate-dependent aminotransferase [Chloroflexota bacterium]
MKYDFDRVIDRRDTESIKWQAYPRDVLPMWVADTDFESPQPVIDAILKRAQHGIFGYPERPASYSEAIIDWMRARHGWDIKREWIVNNPGVVAGLILAINTFTQPGDKIIIQPPVYHPFFHIVKNNGRQIVENPLREENGYYRMDLADLEKQIDSRTKALILCSPHNPVGRVWTKDELTALGEICLRRNVLIFSDEIHSDLILRGNRHTPLAMISPELADLTLTFIAPSKTFNIPGMFTSALIIPNPKLNAQFCLTLENMAQGHGNIFGMIALEAAYRHGAEWLAQMLEYLQDNIDFTIRFFNERIPQIKVACPEGTYLLWLDCRALGLDQQGLRDLFLKKSKVALNDGSIFGVQGEGFMRMNIGCPRSVLQEGLERIERAVNGQLSADTCT